MVLAQVATTILMAVTFKHEAPPLYAIILIEVFVCMFTAGFAYSWGPLGWLVRDPSFHGYCKIFGSGLLTLRMWYFFYAGSNRNPHH